MGYSFPSIYLSEQKLKHKIRMAIKTTNISFKKLLYRLNDIKCRLKAI